MGTASFHLKLPFVQKGDIQSIIIGRETEAVIADDFSNSIDALLPQPTRSADPLGRIRILETDLHLSCNSNATYRQ